MNLDHLTPEHARFYRSILHPVAGDELRSWLRNRGALPATPKLGLNGLHSPKIALGDHLAAEATPPSHLHRGEFPGYADILGNDSLGNCGPCQAIHATEGIDHAAGNPTPPFVAADSIQFYSEEAGYVAGDPSTDNGTDNAVMVKQWQDVGIHCSATKARHKIVGTLFVDPNNQVQNRVAIVEFGHVCRAVNLPLSAQGQRVWSVAGDGKTGNSAPGSWGGHDIVGLAYDPDTIDWNSWGMWLPGTTEFDRAYALQGFVVMTQEMLSRRGVSPTGLNWTSLNAAFAKLVPGGDASVTA